MQRGTVETLCIGPESMDIATWRRVASRFVGMRIRHRDSVPEAVALRRHGHSESNVAKVIDALYVGRVTSVSSTVVLGLIAPAHEPTPNGQ